MSHQLLVVDDEPDIRELFKEILEDEGYEVEVAHNAEPRDLPPKSAPDLVLLDIWMPDTDGITLLKEWSESGNDDAPVIMMSGHGTVETAWRRHDLAPTTSSKSLCRWPSCSDREKRAYHCRSNPRERSAAPK